VSLEKVDVITLGTLNQRISLTSHPQRVATQLPLSVALLQRLDAGPV
jgi:hypothetical protein